MLYKITTCHAKNLKANKYKIDMRVINMNVSLTNFNFINKALICDTF